MFPRNCKKCGEKFNPTGRANFLCDECFDKTRRQRKSDVPLEERERLKKEYRSEMYFRLKKEKEDRLK